jgi:hypothetical protein
MLNLNEVEMTIDERKKEVAQKIIVCADRTREKESRKLTSQLIENLMPTHKEFFVEQRRLALVVFDTMSAMSGFVYQGEGITRFGFGYLASAATDPAKQNALVSYVDTKRSGKGQFETAIRSAEMYLLNRLGSTGIGFSFYSNAIKYYARVLLSGERITTVYSAVAGKEISLLTKLNDAITDAALNEIESSFEKELVDCIPSASEPRR